MWVTHELLASRIAAFVVDSLIVCTITGVAFVKNVRDAARGSAAAEV